MSIDIDWKGLTTGPEGLALAESIKTFIHDKFQQVQLPRFIRSVEVHAFDFGKECPVIELKDICDPLSEFYDADDEKTKGDDSGETKGDNRQQARDDSGNQPRENKKSLLPVLTPGIPGGTSNLSYFHLPLSAGLSGTTTPLAAVAGAWSESHLRHQHSPIQSPSSPSTSDSSTTDPLDTQIVLHISYTGTVRLSITAEILLDYPMPSFVGIPLQLNITGLSFDGVALLAYLGKKAHFCFLSTEDARTFVGREETGGLLREIRVESEIGRQEQVLRNVGKVEKFVLEQVRRIFEEEFVWPSFWTFLL